MLLLHVFWLSTCISTCAIFGAGYHKCALFCFVVPPGRQPKTATAVLANGCAQLREFLNVSTSIFELLSTACIRQNIRVACIQPTASSAPPRVHVLSAVPSRVLSISLTLECRRGGKQSPLPRPPATANSSTPAKKVVLETCQAIDLSSFLYPIFLVGGVRVNQTRLLGEMKKETKRLALSLIHI